MSLLCSLLPADMAAGSLTYYPPGTASGSGLAPITVGFVLTDDVTMPEMKQYKNLRNIHAHTRTINRTASSNAAVVVVVVLVAVVQALPDIALSSVYSESLELPTKKKCVCVCVRARVCPGSARHRTIQCLQ